MRSYVDIYYDLGLRAASARRRNEHLVVSLEEAIAIHDGLLGPAIPYQHPDLYLGVPVRVLEHEQLRIAPRRAPTPRRNPSGP